MQKKKNYNDIDKFLKQKFAEEKEKIPDEKVKKILNNVFKKN